MPAFSDKHNQAVWRHSGSVRPHSAPRGCRVSPGSDSGAWVSACSLPTCAEVRPYLRHMPFRLCSRNRRDGSSVAAQGSPFHCWPLDTLCNCSMESRLPVSSCIRPVLPLETDGPSLPSSPGASVHPLWVHVRPWTLSAPATLPDALSQSVLSDRLQLTELDTAGQLSALCRGFWPELQLLGAGVGAPACCVTLGSVGRLGPVGAPLLACSPALPA